MTTTTCPCECHLGTNRSCNFNGGCGAADHRHLPLTAERREVPGLGTTYTGHNGRTVHVTWDACFAAYLVSLADPTRGELARFILEVPEWWMQAELDDVAARVLFADPTLLPQSYAERLPFTLLAA